MNLTYQTNEFNLSPRPFAISYPSLFFPTRAILYSFYVAVYMCICICAYMCVYVYMYVFMYTYMYISIICVFRCEIYISKLLREIYFCLTLLFYLFIYLFIFLVIIIIFARTSSVPDGFRASIFVKSRVSKQINKSIM